MFFKVQKSLFSCPTNVVKNSIRKYSLPDVAKNDKTESVYPPILDLSRKGKIKMKKEQWHNKIKKLETVEEKLYGINMPRYYGWKSLHLQENLIPYNSLSQAQYITRTHVVEDRKLPEFYNNVATNDELDTMVQNIKSHVENAIVFEYCSRSRQHEVTEKADLQKVIANTVACEVNRIMLSTLSSGFPHLLEAEVDFEPRSESFWFVGGINPPECIRKPRASSERTKEYADEPVDIPVQYYGSPILQLRHSLPLKEVVSLSESENPELTVPQFKWDPRVLGYTFSYRHATNIPGFWPGDPSEFGLLSFRNTSHLNQRLETYADDLEALQVQAIFASYSWLLSQACYQGFSTVNDVTYPLVTQTVLTDGQLWSFCVYQLNTTLLHSEYIDENPKRNICWITEPMKLFDEVDKEKVHGLNEEVLKMLLRFYVNVPEERQGVNMKPYLGKTVKHFADIEDEERRVWLERSFKHLMSNRPRHYKIPQIYPWQKIYLINHKQKAIDKKRDPWQFGYKPMKRRLNDHLPIYVPKCLREYPKLRKVGRWAKTYYPDA